jgi:hypothetical protein
MSFEQINLFGDVTNPSRKEKIKTIISASRRTDIPAFYYSWLQDVLKNKEVELKNPKFPSKTYKVDLSPENLHSIVLWSKDFSNVAKDPGLLSNYNLYFQYTINRYSRLLEPNVPDYCCTIKTLEVLLRRYMPEQFNIRFDPVIISRTKGEISPTPECPPKARLHVFEQLCKDLKLLGLNKGRLTTSYISFYGHVQKRINQCGIDIVYLNENELLSFFENMVDIADKYNIKLYTCASPILEKVNGMNAGHCIDGNLLVSLFGGNVSIQKDKGQRSECKCSLSRDIGSYSNGVNAMKCLFNCKYCYVR